MTRGRRPLVAVPGRFAATATGLRFGAVVNARALTNAVLRAGGEPLTVHPAAPGGAVEAAEVAERLAFADAVLLPGGGDVAPGRYGEEAVEQVYGVDDEQDGFDLAVARWALDAGVPLLAVCRGAQVVNVALGGSLEQHMEAPHRPLTHEVGVTAGTRLAGVLGPVSGTTAPSVSCSHHQRLSRLGSELVVTTVAADGTIEAVELPDAPGWFLGVQWHPEDTAETDKAQHAVFAALIEAARQRVNG